jgi:hypothetical protein
LFPRSSDMSLIAHSFILFSLLYFSLLSLLSWHINIIMNISAPFPSFHACVYKGREMCFYMGESRRWNVLCNCFYFSLFGTWPKWKFFLCQLVWVVYIFLYFFFMCIIIYVTKSFKWTCWKDLTSRSGGKKNLRYKFYLMLIRECYHARHLNVYLFVSYEVSAWKLSSCKFLILFF